MISMKKDITDAKLEAAVAVEGGAGLARDGAEHIHCEVSPRLRREIQRSQRGADGEYTFRERRRSADRGAHAVEAREEPNMSLKITGISPIPLTRNESAQDRCLKKTLSENQRLVPSGTSQFLTFQRTQAGQSTEKELELGSAEQRNLASHTKVHVAWSSNENFHSRSPLNEESATASAGILSKLASQAGVKSHEELRTPPMLGPEEKSASPGAGADAGVEPSTAEGRPAR
jgi:hypothetical protein